MKQIITPGDDEDERKSLVMTLPGLFTHLSPHGIHVCMVGVKKMGGLKDKDSLRFYENISEKFVFFYFAVISRLQADHRDTKFGELLS